MNTPSAPNPITDNPPESRVTPESPQSPQSPQSADTAAQRRSPGRPSTYAEFMVSSICQVIFETGASDTAAGEGAGVPSSTLSRWKEEHDDLQERLDMARAQFRAAKLREINEAKMADGRRDWRAAAWLLERSFPLEYSRRAVNAPPPPPPEKTERNPALVFSEKDMEEIRDGRLRYLEKDRLGRLCNGCLALLPEVGRDPALGFPPGIEPIPSCRGLYGSEPASDHRP